MNNYPSFSIFCPFPQSLQMPRVSSLILTLILYSKANTGVWTVPFCIKIVTVYSVILRLFDPLLFMVWVLESHTVQLQWPHNPAFIPQWTSSLVWSMVHHSGVIRRWGEWAWVFLSHFMLWAFFHLRLTCFLPRYPSRILYCVSIPPWALAVLFSSTGSFWASGLTASYGCYSLHLHNP